MNTLEALQTIRPSTTKPPLLWYYDATRLGFINTTITRAGSGVCGSMVSLAYLISHSNGVTVELPDLQIRDLSAPLVISCTTIQGGIVDPRFEGVVTTETSLVIAPNATLENLQYRYSTDAEPKLTITTHPSRLLYVALFYKRRLGV